MKKCWSILCVCAVMLGMLPLMAVPTAVSAETEGDFEYMVLEDGTAEITGYTGSERRLTIPSTLGGYTVTAIGDRVFKGKTSLQSITIPDGVTSIGAYAFYECEYLNNVTFGSDVIRIGEWAFYRCLALVSVTLPNGLTRLENRVFSGCDSLAIVSIPSSVTSIGNDAFSYCDSLSGITIPNSVTSIGNHAFYWSKSLKSVVIPSSVTDMGSAVFANCTSLASATIGGVTSIADSMFSNCTALTRITMPYNITAIENNAFYRCTSLASVSIPNSVTSFGAYAFDECTSLKRVLIPDGAQSIGDSAFRRCSSLISVTIPDSVTSIGYNAFNECTSLENITIGNGVIRIGKYAFEHTAYYENETNWENGVLYIGNYMIDTNSTLPDVYSVRSGTRVIADAAFYSRYSLKNITIPDSVIGIGDEAFGGSSLLGIHTVYYSGMKNEWDMIKIGEGNDNLLSAQIHYNTMESHWSDPQVIVEPTCTKTGEYGSTCPCGYSKSEEIPATGHDEEFVVKIEPTCTEKGYTRYRCKVCDAIADKEYVSSVGHVFENGLCTGCGLLKTDLVESEHDYANNCDETWVICRPGALKIAVTFSNQTAVESRYDYIYLCDGDDNEIFKCTGTELAGRTVTLNGDTMKIRLISDGSITAYGFAVTDVQALMPTTPTTTTTTSTVPQPEQTTGDWDGDGVVNMMDALNVYSLFSTGAFPQEKIAWVDMNGNGAINMIDCLKLFNRASGVL